jgi:hypothetical protein
VRIYCAPYGSLLAGFNHQTALALRLISPYKDYSDLKEEVMAQISTRETLSKCLDEKPAANWPHVWVTKDGVLVVGEFPNVRATFDFGAERFKSTDQVMDIGSTGSVQHAQPVTSLAHQVANIEKKEISLIHEAPRWTETIEIETPDAVYKVGSAVRALITGLELVETLAPGTLELLSKEKGRSKRPVSLSRQDLYDLPSQAQYAHKLKNGYWVGTNNKADEAIRNIERAIQLAGLGSKVIVRRKVRT